MSRQIVNTGGQGLAASDGVKFAFASVIIAVVVLLVFYFLNSATKNRTAAMTGVTPIVALATR